MQKIEMGKVYEQGDTLEIGKLYRIGDKTVVLTKTFKLIEAQSIYDVKDGDRYYCINEAGKIVPTTFEDNSYDKNIVEIGNAFLTKDEAQFELERRKVVAKIKRWKHENDNHRFTKYVENYYIEFNMDEGKFEGDFLKSYQGKPNYLYFSSMERVKECLNFIGEENWKKYILEIE